MQGQANGRRRYEHDGEVYPGVTDITSVISKPGLERWKLKQAREGNEQTGESAAEFGTRVHEMAEIALRAGCDPARCHCSLVDRELRPYHDAITDFLASYVAEVLIIEKMFVSPEHRLGGTPDLYCRLENGRLAVVDFKTSKDFYFEYRLQTAAYAMLLSVYGFDVDDRILVQLRKDKPGGYAIQICGDHDRDLRGFLCALELFYWQQEVKLTKPLKLMIR